jgi:predicted TPR repeat methyltransferase
MEKEIKELFTQATDLEAKDEFKSSIEKYKAILELDKTNIDAQFMIGEMHHKLGDLSAALSAYYLTIDLDKDHKKANVKIEMIKSILDFFNPDLYNP